VSVWVNAPPPTNHLDAASALLGFQGTTIMFVAVQTTRLIDSSASKVFVGHGASGMFALTTRFEASAGRLSTPAQSDANPPLVVSARRAFVSGEEKDGVFCISRVVCVGGIRPRTALFSFVLIVVSGSPTSIFR
ncbi:unnamed protein product, partial [Ectocarpus sp. 4 AP-2014]